ncbi:MAG TPA: protein kinase, partial [Rhodothermales bacterium]|nr:protein kinase [Rhodothermales bacterium]
ERLGGGGMGVVYKAEDTKLGRTVALKFLPPHLSANPNAKERFIHEAKAASALDHPNIGTIHEIGETEDGRLYIAMAYYGGETLKKKIERGPLPVAEVTNYALQMARGMEKAHQAGIIHRDIKPANVLVTEDGLVKIVDFGLAKMADLQLTTTGTRMGTVAYMSPEQARGEGVGQQTDVWALGVVLYELLTGERPFKGDYPEAIVYSVLNEDATPLTALNPNVPPDLEHVVGLCMEKSKDLRYPSMADLLADLEVWAQEKDVPRPSSVRPVLIVGMSVLATLLVLLAIAPIRQEIVKALRLSGLPRQVHLAVLPLMQADADSVDQDFTNGLVETLARKLKQVEQSDQFWIESTEEIRKRAITNSTEAWETFGVNLALIVETERSEDTVRIALTLVDALTQRPIKDAEVIRPVAKLATLSDNLVSELANMLEIDLPPSTRSLLTTGGTATPEAVDFYTRGLGNLQGYQEAKNIDTAIHLFEQAIRRDSSYALAYAGLGEAYLRKFEATKDIQWADQAERYCERALELEDLISPTVYLTLGFINIGRGLPGFAKGAFELALAKEPTSADAYLGLAKAFEALNRIDDAEEAYRRAIELKPDYWAGYNALGVFYAKQQHYEDAIEPFQQVIDLTPLNARGHRNLAAVYFYLNRNQEAYERLEIALEVEPDYAGYYNLANLYFYDASYRQAAETYRKALELQDTDYKVWGALAEAYYWINAGHDKIFDAYERAASLAEEQRKRNPRDQAIYPNLAGYHAMLGDSSKALALLHDVEMLHPLNGEILFQIGVVYEQLNKRDLALQWIDRAINKGYSLVEINRFPGLAELRADKRFQSMLPTASTDEN